MSKEREELWMLAVVASVVLCSVIILEDIGNE